MLVMNIVEPVFNGVIALILISLLAGCRSTPKVASAVSSDKVAATDGSVSQAAAVEPPKPVTFTDKVELQSGTGRMDEDAPTEFLKTESGLKYRVLRKSDGKMPVGSSTVTVNYRGWLNNGKEFDSSYKRGEPISFPLSGVVAGWTEGLQLVGVGGMIELWVPSNLGYGASGSPGSIPPHSTLHFIVELVQVK